MTVFESRTHIIVDGCPGTIVEDYFDTYSQRLHIHFDSPHPTLGSDFMTKYYAIDKDKAACVWGDNRRITWTFPHGAEKAALER